MAQFLLHLPTALAADVVSNWLNVCETVRLDTAFCETTTRPKFAHILSNCRLRFPTYEHGRNFSDHVLAWSLMRDVRLDNLHITEESNLRVYTEFFVKRGSTVFQIYYELGIFSNELVSAIGKHCPHLKDLGLVGHETNGGLDTALRNVLMHCQQLQELSICADTDIELDYLSLQGICCTCLNAMHFDYLHSGAVLAEFFKLAPNLNNLTLRACNYELENGESALQYISPTVTCLHALDLNDEDLIRIVDSCPHVTSITLTDPQYDSILLTVKSIEYMARRLKLTEICFNYGSSTDACLLAVAYHCAGTLTSLEMMHCYGPEVQTINTVLRLCTKLTRFRCHVNDLDYTLLSNITLLNLDVTRQEAHLAEIALHCKKLVHLALYSLGRLQTSEDLDSIVRNCTDLCTLKITWDIMLHRSHYLSEETRAAWKLVRPKLVVTECEYSIYPNVERISHGLHGTKLRSWFGSCHFNSQTMLHVLFLLPTDLAADILSRWAGITGTVVLDTALCESTTRPKFINTLSSCKFHQPPRSRQNTDNLAKWCMKRMTYVDEIYVNEESDLALYEEFLTKCGAAVSRIRLERRARSDVLSTTKLMSLVAVHCCQLIALDWNGAGHGLDAALRDVLSRCTQLQELCVSASIYSGFTAQFLDGIQCPHLRVMSLQCFYSTEISAAFIKIAPNLDSLSMRTFRSQLESGESALQYINPAIRCLEITDSQLTDDELIYIVDRCPHIVNINVSDSGFQGSVLTIRSIEYMAQHLTKLAKVNLSTSNLTNDCLLAVVRHRSQTLTSLDIVQCYGLSIDTINTALRQCTQLTRFGSHLDRQAHLLDFTSLANVTDLHFVVDSSGNCANLLRLIAEHCSKLQHLLLDVLEELESTDELDTIVENCADIRTLKIRAEEYDCGGFVSEEKLVKWKALRPLLVVTDGYIYH